MCSVRQEEKILKKIMFFYDYYKRFCKTFYCDHRLSSEAGKILLEDYPTVDYIIKVTNSPIK